MNISQKLGLSFVAGALIGAVTVKIFNKLTSNSKNEEEKVKEEPLLKIDHDEELLKE